LAILSPRAHRPAIWGGNLGQAAIADGRGGRQGPEERRQLADFSQAARAPAGGTVDEALKGAIWTEMLSVIGLDLPQAARIQHANVREQAAAAWYALDHLAQTNDRLRAFLKDAEDYKIGGVDQKYSDLRGKLADSPNGVALLDEVDRDLQSILRPLLLLPEVGLLQELIDRLEESAQSDDGQSPGEPELRDLLIAIRSEIERIDKASPEAWRRVAHMIQMRKPSSHSLSELNPVNKRAI
jgi:hypothetical protein